MYSNHYHRVVEVGRKREGNLPKILDQEKILSPNIRNFVAILRFVAIKAF